MLGAPWPGSIPSDLDLGRSAGAGFRGPGMRGEGVCGSASPKEYRIDGMSAGNRASAVGRGGRLAEGRGRARDRRGDPLPHTKYALPAYYIIAPAGGLVQPRALRRRALRPRRRQQPRRDVRADPRPPIRQEVKRRILIGTYVLSAGYYDAYYLKAQKVRALIPTTSPRPSKMSIA